MLRVWYKFVNLGAENSTGSPVWCARSLREIGNLLPNNRRQRRTCYALCHILYPVSAAQTSIFRMDSNSTSYPQTEAETSLALEGFERSDRLL